MERAHPGALVPVYRELLADRLTPVSAFERLAPVGASFLLESVEGGERMARYSFIGGAPWLRVRAKGDRVTVEERGSLVERTLAPGADALSVVEELLARYDFCGGDLLPRFCGGAVGYIAYDMVRKWERLPAGSHDDLGIDDAFFTIPDTMVVFDHVKHRMKLVCFMPVGDDPLRDYDTALAEIDRLVEALTCPSAQAPGRPGNRSVRVTQNVTQWDYENAVRRCKEYIAAGDAFQIVPSVRFTADVSAPPFELYRALRSVNPSPYMYYLDVGDRQIVGASPEILVTVEGGTATVRPIAGTRARGASAEADSALEEELRADAKERAEHIMLVDLGRNDVGRVAQFGTVRVDDLMTVERYSHVMHLVSSVSGSLREGLTAFDAVRACFPAGTLTGAPKVRAMEIIDELEPSRRGLYGGAVGYFSFRGDADFAIAIRTMLVDRTTAHIQAGAGIVADSAPESEYRECVNKARALLTAVEMAEAGLD